MPVSIENDAMDIDPQSRDQPKAAVPSSDKYDFDSLLRCYYRMDSFIEKNINPLPERLFPAKEMYQWLSYGNSITECYYVLIFFQLIKHTFYTGSSHSLSKTIFMCVTSAFLMLNHSAEN